MRPTLGLIVTIERCRVLKPNNEGKLIESKIISAEECRQIFWNKIKEEETGFRSGNIRGSSKFIAIEEGSDGNKSPFDAGEGV